MGKEWYWSGSRSSTSKRGGGDKESAAANTTTTTPPSGCMSAVFHFFDFHHFQFPLHHHHQSSFKSTTSFLPDEDNTTLLKGVEAPRNSLELEETPLSSNLKQEEEEEENLKFPMGIQIKTSNNNRDTRSRSLVGGASNYDSSSEISSSPGAKTPNLVARLMGLDLLPETNSPSSSSSSFHEPPNHPPTKLNLHHHLRPRQVVLQNKPIIISHRNSMEVDVIAGTRSLPETPRVSSARRSVDVDHHHRLSLQINKENIGGGEDHHDFSRFSYLRRREIKQEDEYRSPSHYARQIVKQVKESVSRKVGLDITNTLRNRETILQAREEVFSQLKTKKSSSRALNKVASDQTSSPRKHSSTPASCSPRLSRFLEPKQKPVTTTPTITTTNYDNNKDHKIQTQPNVRVLSPKPKLQPVQEQQSSHSDKRPAKKCKKAASERFSPRLKKPPKSADVIRNKQEESFVRPSTANRANNPEKNSKKTPLSNDLFNISVPTLLPVKKEPSPPATKIPQKQVFLNVQSSKRTTSSSQLSSNSSQISYKQEPTRTPVARDNIDRSNGVAKITTTVGGAELEYITRILKRTGLDKHTPVSWFSPSHPLDPSIFHHLENNINPTSGSRCSGQLSLLCNRKLLFQLVDEILVDVLKPVINIKPWCCNYVRRRGHYYGSSMQQGLDLIDTLCLIIESFPCADCRVLEDIDGLIDRDLLKIMKLQNATSFEEEGDGVVIEIEKYILDSLIHETASLIRTS
ncbi:hypothetical protein ACOSP7_027347 [Xanthoceras sorbifolium]|uniref:DUF4378 domain-containing protein n=1 Tax=Xanthoceras sorbifolium TaxID=99658 RepID=A0ABQ8HFZ2_9ROSI|nr:hypothetical protein JRO89_XS11G0177400 [Xanthoceras sorbifolium]